MPTVCLAWCQLLLTAPSLLAPLSGRGRGAALRGGPEEEDLCLHYPVNSVFILDIKQ